MARAPILASLGVVLAGAVLAAALGSKHYVAASANDHSATLDEYCFRCHSSSAPRAGVNLRSLDLANFEHNGVIWEKLLRELRSREMPPPGRWRPDPATYQAFVNYIESGRDHGGSNPIVDAPRCIASTDRRRQIRFAICWR